jgi:hypothetical protein
VLAINTRKRNQSVVMGKGQDGIVIFKKPKAFDFHSFTNFMHFYATTNLL